MKKLMTCAVLVLIVLGGAPAYAQTGAASEGTLSIIEFSRLPENRGLQDRILDRKYDEYRHGRVPRTTLSASNVR